MVGGAPGLALEHAVKPVEGGRRPGTGCATILFRPAGGDLAQGANLKTPPATPIVVVIVLFFLLKPYPSPFTLIHCHQLSKGWGTFIIFQHHLNLPSHL